MDQRARKLMIGAVAVALFVGFIFLTRWTGDNPHSVASMDDGQKADIARFCAVVSSDYVPYETVIKVAAGQKPPDSASESQSDVISNLSGGAGADFLQGVLRNLADSVPETWAADAHQAAEGLQRALHGNLSSQQVDSYVASYKSLQRKASKDCKDVKGVETDFGDRSGPFGG